MAYEGYRLKINDVIFHNVYMAKDSWQCNPNKRRILKSYYTADGKKHDIFSSESKADIRFSIRECNMEDHAKIASFFDEKENVSITFWNDQKCIYETRICNISDIDWASSAIGNELFYKAASVVITEN